MHDGHRERVREKYKKSGLSEFADHEILEMLLFYANKRSDTNATAHNLISRFGSLSAVFEASFDELKTVDGIGEVAATLLTMVPELFRRYKQDKAKARKEITSPEQAAEYLLPHFFGLKTERCALLCLDVQSRVNNLSFISDGSLRSAQIDMRKVAQISLQCNADSVIIAHNHPGGLPIPSRSDLSSTSSMISTLKTLGVRVVDHIIISDNDWFSMASTPKFSPLFMDKT